jgi:uncharacterized protein YwqG
MTTTVHQFLEALTLVTRQAHIPEIQAGEKQGNGSRYFGRPWMSIGAMWPQFEGQSLQFVLQLNTAELPSPWGASIDEAELISFFYDVESDTSEIKRTPINQPGQLVAVPSDLDPLPALSITSWQPVLDHPSTEDFEEVFGNDRFDDLVDELGSSTVGQFLGQDGRECSEATSIEEGELADYHCFECDKLGGWPCWEQGNETPADSEDNPMTFMFQVGFEGLLMGQVPEDINWPTWGRGQIFFSRKTGEFRYVWACD